MLLPNSGITSFLGLCAHRFIFYQKARRYVALGLSQSNALCIYLKPDE